MSGALFTLTGSTVILHNICIIPSALHSSTCLRNTESPLNVSELFVAPVFFAIWSYAMDDFTEDTLHNFIRREKEPHMLIVFQCACACLA